MKKDSSKKAEVVELVIPTAQEALAPVKKQLETITSETHEFIISGLRYLMTVGQQLQEVKAHFETLKSKYKKTKLEIYEGDTLIADLTKVKKNPKTGVLGFWDYLSYKGLLPFGYQQVLKRLNVADNEDYFADLPDSYVAQHALTDANNASQFAVHMKNGGTLENFKGQTKGSDKETRSTFSVFAKESQLNISYFESKYKTPHAVKVALLNAWIGELGWNSISPTQRAGLIESAKQISKTEAPKRVKRTPKAKALPA